MSTATPLTTPPTIGSRIGERYRILRKIGEGGMGVVYLAQHLELEHLVAVKLLRPELRASQELAERFAREARAMAQVECEHVVRIIDVGHGDGAGPYIVMEHLEGETLQSLLKREGPLPMLQACHYVIDAACGVASAHSNGIIHRDLKPDNLYLCQSPRGERVKLLDFGVCMRTSTLDPALTQPRVALGSPYYMAPEQLQAAPTLDARTDVWALGVVLYELTTQRLPFDGDSLPEIYARIMYTTPLPPSAHAVLPPTFDALVLSCLSRDPGQRPASVQVLAKALTQLRAAAYEGEYPSIPPVTTGISQALASQGSWSAVTVTRSAENAVSTPRRRWAFMPLVLGCAGYVAVSAGLAVSSNSRARHTQPEPHLDRSTSINEVAPTTVASRSTPIPVNQRRHSASQRTVDGTQSRWPPRTSSTSKATPAETAAPEVSVAPTRGRVPSRAESQKLKPQPRRQSRALPDFGGRR